jgi:hypothetical protein
MSDPGQNRRMTCKRFFASQEDVGRAVYPASRVHVSKRSSDRVWGIKPSGDQAYTPRRCRDDWRFPLGALTVSVQLRAESAHIFTNSCCVRTEGACGVPLSQRLRETTGPTFQSSKSSGGLTTSWDDAKTVGRLFLQLSIQNDREVPQSEKVSSRSQNAQL